MEKLKLTELQKFELLHRGCTDIVSQGKPYPCHRGLWPYDFVKVSFKTSYFSHKNGATIDVRYAYNADTSVTVMWKYAPVRCAGAVVRFELLPKSVLIERPFESSVLLAIVPDPDNSVFIYQSLKSIQELCEGDSVGVDAGAEPAGACLVAEDVKTPAL